MTTAGAARASQWCRPAVCPRRTGARESGSCWSRWRRERRWRWTSRSRWARSGTTPWSTSTGPSVSRCCGWRCCSPTTRRRPRTSSRTRSSPCSAGGTRSTRPPRPATCGRRWSTASAACTGAGVVARRHLHAVGPRRTCRRPTSRVLLTEDHREVVEALRTLPRRQREVLVLRYWSELSEAEIAAALGIARGTVKSSASRGAGRRCRSIWETAVSDDLERRSATSSTRTPTGRRRRDEAVPAVPPHRRASALRRWRGRSWRRPPRRRSSRGSAGHRRPAGSPPPPGPPVGRARHSEHPKVVGERRRRRGRRRPADRPRRRSASAVARASGVPYAVDLYTHCGVRRHSTSAASGSPPTRRWSRAPAPAGRVGQPRPAAARSRCSPGPRRCSATTLGTRCGCGADEPARPPPCD